MRKSEFSDFDLKEKITCGEYLADTDELLYAHSFFDSKEKRQKNEILLKNCTTGESRVITAGKPGEGNPRISPDGSRVLFLGAVGNSGRQLFIKGLAGGDAVQLTSMRFGVMDPIWSPDGKMILFTSAASDSMDEEWLQTPVNIEEQRAYEAEKAKEPVVITDFGYKFDGAGFSKPEVLQLFVISAEGGKARKISSGNANFLHGGWAPDSRTVICESNLFCSRENSIAIDVLTINIDTCEIKRLTENRMVVSYPNPVRPVYTADGKYIIAGILDIKEGKEDSTYPSCTLYRISVESGELTPISVKTGDCFDTVSFPYNADCGGGLEKVRVSSDGQYVMFHSGSRGECRIWKTAIYGEDHTPVPLVSGKYAYNGMGVPAQGKVLAACTEPDRPEAYYLIDEKTGEKRLLLQSNEEWCRNVSFSSPEDFFFETLDGEGMVQGFCLPPQQAEKGRKYPAIVYVHGGPHPFYTYGFDLEMQCFAAAGFAVLYCNPRGSSGYGDIHRNIERAFDGSAYTDILQFTEEACRRYPWIDENRLGMTGGSYGGYMTNYTAARAKKFRAYISQRSVVNELISYASSDMQGDSTDCESFEEFMATKINESVICGADKVEAPFLIMHGMEDLRCPVEGAHQLFTALKDSHSEDFPVKMVLYPHCGHSQPTIPSQRQHYYRTMKEWFERYL